MTRPGIEPRPAGPLANTLSTLGQGAGYIHIYIYTLSVTHTCAHTHTQTHTHIYIYIYIYEDHSVNKVNIAQRVGNKKHSL